MRDENDTSDERSEVSSTDLKSSDYRKRSRTVMTPSQSKILKRYFDINTFPSTEVREELAKSLGMKPRTVQIWFQNQRQKTKNRYEFDNSYCFYEPKPYYHFRPLDHKGLDILADAALGKISERRRHEHLKNNLMGEKQQK